MINITWDPPIDIGDGIKGYTVKWQEVNGTSRSMQKVVPLFFFIISFYLLLSYNPSFLIRLCFNMVSFRGQKMLGPRPDRSPLRV